MLREPPVHSFSLAALSPDPDLAVAALMIARLEYPKLDAGPYLDELDTLGREARRRVEGAGVRADTPGDVDAGRYAQVMALNEYLFDELRFSGNEVSYEDPRNSFLNEVMERRTGIPITLALIYMEIARRAGLRVEGINFPGHFLLRCPARRSHDDSRDLIIDAFHRGALLSEDTCLTLLRRHTGEHAAFEPALLRHASKPEILARMLVNLKRIYVRMHSFPQARAVTGLLLAVDPTATGELRDRGLLAYHLRDFAAALRDLQEYLLRSATETATEESRKDQAEIWEHVKTLRRRMASFN